MKQDDNSIKKYRISGKHKFLAWTLAFLAVISFILPPIIIVYEKSADNYTHGLLAVFFMWPMAIICLLVSLGYFRYKIILTEEYIQANKLNKKLLNSSGHYFFLGYLSRFQKKHVQINFCDVLSCRIEKQYFSSYRGGFMLFALIFSMKDVTEQKIDIELSSKKKEEILNFLKQKIEVVETPPPDESHAKFIDDIKSGKIK